MPEMYALKSEEQSQQLQLVEREDIEDEEDLFEAIDKLISHGINAGDVKKLQDAGIYTCNGLMMQTKKNLTGIKGLSEAKVDKICEAAEKIVVELKRQQSLKHLENFGEQYIAGSGKTQLAHTLCVSTQLPTSMRGGNGKVAYIDTEGTFRPDRIVPIAERFGMDAAAVLDNIIYARAYTYEHQYNLLLGLAAKMAEEPFRLLIVDSVIALFRVDFSGRGELAERQQKLAQMLSRLMKIAEEFNIAIYLTNQVIADPAGGVFVTDPKKPAGGHVLAHASTIRLMFRKGKGEQRICKVFDAPNLPEAEAISFGVCFWLKSNIHPSIL
ncbi:Meiotic recombination protein DMC1-like protein [Bienertia sinuspersici]